MCLDIFNVFMYISTLTNLCVCVCVFVSFLPSLFYLSFYLFLDLFNVFIYTYIHTLTNLCACVCFPSLRNSIAGSAICSFNMTSINATFQGPFKFQPSQSSVWGPVTHDNTHFRCLHPQSTREDELAADKYQLMDRPVVTQDPHPLFTVDDERWVWMREKERERGMDD